MDTQIMVYDGEGGWKYYAVDVPFRLEMGMLFDLQDTDGTIQLIQITGCSYEILMRDTRLGKVGGLICKASANVCLPEE